MIGLLNDAGAAWGAYFGPIVLQNTVFLAIVLVVLRLLKNAPARVRYAVGMVGVVKLLLPPFLPVRLSESTNAILIPLSQIVPGTAPITSVAGPETLASAAERPEWPGLLFAVWFSVTAIYIIATVVSTLRLRIALRGAHDITETMASHYVGATPIGLYQTDRIAMPLTIGLMPTKVFVPAVWNQWSEECRRMIIRHEVAHIRRRDGIVQILQIVAQSLYFFHPLVWYLNRRVNEYREMACDDTAAGLGSGTRLRYSQHLANIAESAILSPLTGDSVSALLRRKHELLNRIQYQLKEGKMNSLSRVKTALMVVGLALLIVPLSGYVGTSAPGDQNKDTQAAMPEDGKLLYVTVGIIAGDEVEVNDTRTKMAGFKETILANLDMNPENVVLKIVCKDNTQMGALFDVQRALAELDLLKVSYMSDSWDAFPLVLPSKKLEERMKEIPAKMIAELVIDPSGVITLDGNKTEFAKLDKVVEDRISDNPGLVVSVRADRKATYGRYVSVLNQLKKAGAQRIFIQNTPS